MRGDIDADGAEHGTQGESRKSVGLTDRPTLRR
jgi:hypothetical protein